MYHFQGIDITNTYDTVRKSEDNSSDSGIDPIANDWVSTIET